METLVQGQLSELAALMQIGGGEVLAGVGRGLHHHVDAVGSTLGVDDRGDVVERGGHRHGAGAVLARPEHGEAVLGVEADRGGDVHGVPVVVGEEILDRLVTASMPCSAATESRRSASGSTTATSAT